MGKWVIDVPIDVPSENQLLRGRSVRVRVGKRKTLRQNAKWAFTCLAKKHKMPKATGKRIVTWERILGKGQREFDAANLIGGLKPIEDGMVDAGLLVDDKPIVYEGRYIQQKNKRSEGPLLRVYIEDVE